MIKPDLPDYPFQIIGTDLFELKGHQYLLIVDYFSHCPELAKLTTTTSSVVINKLKEVNNYFNQSMAWHSVAWNTRNCEDR